MTWSVTFQTMEKLQWLNKRLLDVQIVTPNLLCHY